MTDIDDILEILDSVGFLDHAPTFPPPHDRPTHKGYPGEEPGEPCYPEQP